MSSRGEKIALVVAYFIIAIGLGIRPYNRGDWALENSVPFLEGLAAVLYYKIRRVELTRLSYWLIFSHLVTQMIGGHYTYAKVPFFDWLKNYFHWQRNHYDRVGHFAVGFCLYIPLREIYLRRTPLSASKKWAAFFAFTTITAIGGLWEVWEWIVSEVTHPELAAEYLGLQGDTWDAQKDILLAPVGALAAIFCWTRAHDKQLSTIEVKS